MKYIRMHLRIVPLALALVLTAIWNSAGWSHGEETMIMPETLSAKSGGSLKVEVMGLVGSQTATFSLTGISGKYDLGQFPISGDDFTQVLQIPSDLLPGNYRLTVEGGGKSAKVVITID